MKTPRPRPSAFPALAWRITALVLALWLLAMGTLTWAVAQDMYYQLETGAWNRAEIYARSYISAEKEQEYLPGYMEYEVLRDIDIYHSVPRIRIQSLLPFVMSQTPSSYGSGDWFWGKWELLFGYQEALVFADPSRDIVLTSGNYIYFPYVTQETWSNRDTTYEGYAYVDLDALGSEITGAPPESCIRMTGWFEENEFHPVYIKWAYDSPLDATIVDFERMNRLDLRDQLTWETAYTCDPPEGQALTTIYGWGWDWNDVRRCEYDAGDPLTVNGVQYGSLLELLKDFRETGSLGQHTSESLLDGVIVAGSSALISGTENERYMVYLAFRCHPLQYAMLRLIPAYLVSFAVVALLVYLLLRRIRKNLTLPLEYALQHSEPLSDAEKAWLEPGRLWTAFHQTRLDLREAQNKVQQLLTALDFSKNAEENRRQLVSNLAHELKTPLAIVHSYAEGLEAGIAGEKQDQYLSTILEESERMDAMVLEMLDLSRLEAGKVRLAADTFSLPALTESIVEKLTLQAEAKHLSIHYGLMSYCIVTADEARIGQVITNLVTNAIKYSPEGGEIRISVYVHQGSARFSIENTCEPLPEESLDKIWTSFYRADTARTAGGHGLGLSIVKSIVELHRGTCSVQNTPTGVRFCFTLPL